MAATRRHLLTGMAALAGGPVLAAPKSARLPFTRESGMVTIEMEVEGQPILAAIDNGAAFSLLDEQLAAQLGKKAESRVRLNGVPARVAGPTSFRVAGWPVSATPVISDLSPVSGVLGRPIKAILGYELFAAAVVQFDFVASRMTLHPPGTRGPFGMDRIELTALPGRKFAAPMRFARNQRVSAMIDLGASSALAVSRSLADRFGFTELRPQSTAASQVFIGDQPRLFTSRLATAPSLDIFGETLTGAPLEILAPDEPVFSRYGVTVGAPILSRYDLWFDLPGRRVWARPNRNLALPFERDRVGLQGYMEAGAFRIMHVREKSPAWQAGLSTRDRVEAVNGKPAGEMIPEIKYAAPAGRTYILDLVGGRSVTLVAADYY